jgi:hypothetical protein
MDYDPLICEKFKQSKQKALLLSLGTCCECPLVPNLLGGTSGAATVYMQKMKQNLSELGNVARERNKRLLPLRDSPPLQVQTNSQREIKGGRFTFALSTT